jgi:hypothetical protein
MVSGHDLPGRSRPAANRSVSDLDKTVIAACGRLAALRDWPVLSSSRPRPLCGHEYRRRPGWPWRQRGIGHQCSGRRSAGLFDDLSGVAPLQFLTRRE